MVTDSRVFTVSCSEPLCDGFVLEEYFALSVSRKKMKNSLAPVGLEVVDCKWWITGCKGAVGDCKQFFTEQSQALLKGRINLVHWNRT